MNDAKKILKTTIPAFLGLMILILSVFVFDKYFQTPGASFKAAGPITKNGDQIIIDKDFAITPLDDRFQEGGEYYNKNVTIQGNAHVTIDSNGLDNPVKFKSLIIKDNATVTHSAPNVDNYVHTSKLDFTARWETFTQNARISFIVPRVTPHNEHSGINKEDGVANQKIFIQKKINNVWTDQPVSLKSGGLPGARYYYVDVPNDDLYKVIVISSINRNIYEDTIFRYQIPADPWINIGFRNSSRDRNASEENVSGHWQDENKTKKGYVGTYYAGLVNDILSQANSNCTDKMWELLKLENDPWPEIGNMALGSQGYPRCASSSNSRNIADTSYCDARTETLNKFPKYLATGLNLDIQSHLLIFGNAKINVDSKGYYGGGYQNGNYNGPIPAGYGPAGGGAVGEWVNTSWSNGGGYGGQGRKKDNSSPKIDCPLNRVDNYGNNIHPSNSLNPEIFKNQCYNAQGQFCDNCNCGNSSQNYIVPFGSGGGAASTNPSFSSDREVWVGGRGGGYVNIKANNIQLIGDRKISADGSKGGFYWERVMQDYDQTSDFDGSLRPNAGGGSGGTIEINANYLTGASPNYNKHLPLVSAGEINNADGKFTEGGRAGTVCLSYDPNGATNCEYAFSSTDNTPGGEIVEQWKDKNGKVINQEDIPFYNKGTELTASGGDNGGGGGRIAIHAPLTEQPPMTFDVEGDVHASNGINIDANATGIVTGTTIQGITSQVKKIENYSISPEGSSSWQVGRAEMDKNILRLEKIAKNFNPNINDLNPDDLPEGGVWKWDCGPGGICDLGTKTFSGNSSSVQGTIIVNGSLNINGLASIGGNIGFIVKGQVVRLSGAGASPIGIYAPEAQIIINPTSNFVLNGITVGKSIRFDIGSGVRSININYPISFAKNPPPGFGYLQLPTIREIAP